MKTPDEQVHALRLLQWRAHKQIDTIYEPLGPQVAAIIEKHAMVGPAGVTILTPHARETALREIDALLQTIEPKLAGVIAGAMTSAETLGEEG